MYNIVAAIFEVESEGYQALTTLSKTPSSTRPRCFRWHWSSVRTAF